MSATISGVVPGVYVPLAYNGAEISSLSRPHGTGLVVTAGLLLAQLLEWPHKKVIYLWLTPALTHCLMWSSASL